MRLHRGTCSGEGECGSVDLRQCELEVDLALKAADTTPQGDLQERSAHSPIPTLISSHLVVLHAVHEGRRVPTPPIPTLSSPHLVVLHAVHEGRQVPCADVVAHEHVGVQDLMEGRRGGVSRCSGFDGRGEEEEGRRGSVNAQDLMEV